MASMETEIAPNDVEWVYEVNPPVLFLTQCKSPVNRHRLPCLFWLSDAESDARDPA